MLLFLKKNINLSNDPNSWGLEFCVLFFLANIKHDFFSLFPFYLFVLFFNLFIYLFNHLFIYLCIYLFIHLFVCLFVYLFIYLFIHLFIYFLFSFAL